MFLSIKKYIQILYDRKKEFKLENIIIKNKKHYDRFFHNFS